jgi:hypothetical protein
LAHLAFLVHVAIRAHGALLAIRAHGAFLVHVALLARWGAFPVNP